MANLDTLNIQINATTRSADKAIANLEKNVRNLNKSLAGINTNSLTRLSVGIQGFAQGVQGFKGVSDKKMTKIANGISAIAKVDASNMAKLSNGLISMGAGLSTMNGVDYKSISSLMNSLSKLGASASGLNTVNFSNVENGIASLTTSLASAPTVSRSITSLMSAIARLGNAGGTNVASVTSALPAMGVAIKKLATNLKSAPLVATETTQLVSAIGALANAGGKTATTATNLSSLGQSVIDLMNQLQNAPEVSDKTVRLVTALGQLASAGSSTSRVFNAISNMGGRTTSVFGKMKNAVDKLTNSFKKGRSSSQGFISSIGMMYAKCWIAIRAVKKLWSAIESGADYVETYNYFRAAWNQVADNADLSSWKELGYASAEEYVNSFSERSKQLTETLSGYSIGSDGSLSMTGEKSLGVDPNMIMNYQAQFGQMASSMGTTSENAVVLSSALSRIGLDLASVKNLNFTDTLDDLSSGLTGQSRVLDKYGINIRVAAMNEKLAQLGIDATASSLGQADKALLRTIIILDSSKYAWGDLSETINAPSNQLRLLSANLSNAGRMLGSLFLPIVKAVLPYVNALAIAVNRLLEYLGTLIGLDFSDIASNTESPDNSGISDYLDSVEDADEAQSDAAKSAKEWKNQLLGFDEITKLDATSDSDSGSGSGSGGVGSASSALTDALADALSDYDKVWNEAYANMENNSTQLANRIQYAFKKAWITGDGSDIGSSIANGINKGITWVKNHQDKFNSGLSKVASILGTGINGFVSKLQWADLGTVLGNGIKGALEAKRTFFKTVNWANLGKNISTTLNSFISSGVIESYLGLAADKLRAAIEFAFGSIENFDFKSLGKHIGNGINEFFDDMGEINSTTGLTGWQELGRSISDGIKGIADAINEALDTVNWDEVGKAIGNFLSEIDWVGILPKVAKALGKAFIACLQAWFNSFEKSPLNTTIATAFTLVASGVIKLPKFQSSGATLGSALVSDLRSSIGTKLAESSFGTGISSALETATAGIGTTAGVSIGGAVVAGIATAFVGWHIGNAIYDGLATDENGDNVIDRFVTKVGDGIKSALGKKSTKSDITDEANAKKQASNAKKTTKSVVEATKAYLGEGNAAKFASISVDSLSKSISTSNTASYEAAKGASKLKTSVESVPNSKTVTFKSNTTDVDTATHEASKGVSKLVTMTSQKDANFDTNVSTATADVSKNVVLNSDKKNDKLVNAITTLGGSVLKPKVKLQAATPISDLAKQWKADFEKNFKPTWTLKINGVKGTVKQSTNGAYWVAENANGGLFRNGKWENIARYAAGGTPTTGQAFIAREAGAELVGNIGGHTAVMNNDQIVSSVSKGVQVAVANAMSPFISQISNAVSNAGGGNVYMDSTLVTNAILQNAHDRKVTTGGTNVFMSI